MPNNISYPANQTPFALTTAVCPKGQFATKRVLLDWRGVEHTTEYDFVKLWQFHPKEFADLDDLAKLLTALVTEPRMCVLRGAPVIDDPGLWQQRQWASDSPTLKAVARQWVAARHRRPACCRPRWGGVRIWLRRRAEFVRDRWLPAEFRGIRSVVDRDTASTGREGRRDDAAVSDVVSASRSGCRRGFVSLGAGFSGVQRFPT